MKLLRCAFLVMFAMSAAAQGVGMKQVKTLVGGDYVSTSNAITALAAESATRYAGDTNLQALISTEASARHVSDTNEAALRSAGDVGLTNYVDLATNLLTQSTVPTSTVFTVNGQGGRLGTNNAVELVFPVTSVNGNTGDVSVTAASIGALTPAATNGLPSLGTTFTVNGWGGLISTNNAITGLASISSLYTLMATSRIDRVWVGTNAWYTFEPGQLVYSVMTDMWEFDHDATQFAMLWPIESGVYGVWTVAEGASAIYGPNDWASFGLFSTNDTTIFVYSASLDEYSSLTYLGNIPFSTYYYLPTNQPLYTETWSRTDMSSWISTNQYVGVTATNVFNDLIAGACDVGGIVFSTAFDAANTMMNHHLAADNPHFSVKRLNGAATNLTVIGGNVSGDTLIGAQGVTNAIASAQRVLSTRYVVSNVSDVAGYLVLTNSPSTNAVKQVVISNPDVDTYILGAISEPFGSAYTLPGDSKVTCRAYATVASGTATLQAHFYITDAAGTTVHEWDTGSSVPLPSALGDGEWFEVAHADSLEVLPTQRRAIRFKVVAKTGAPVITFHLENGRQMTVDLPVPSSYFVNYSELTGYVPTNKVNLVSTTLMDGALNGTNGVYFTRLGTNFWILLY